MASVNKVILIGNLGKDPELRYIQNGDAVASFSLATTDQWKDANGEKKEHTEWHRCVAWRRLAEVIGEYAKKGTQMYIEGKLQTRKWQDKDGQDRYATEIVVGEMKLLGNRVASPEGRSSHGDAARPQGGQESSPKRASFDDMDDDIPFLFNMNTLCDTMGAPKALWRAKHGKGMLLLRANQADF